MGLGIKIPKNAFAKGREKFKEGDDFNNVELEPGVYVAAVVDGRGVDSKNGPQIVFDCKVGGECDESIRGGRTSLWFSFEENRVAFLFRFLALLGYDVDDLDEKMLEEIIADVKENKPVIRLKASQSGDYVNVRATKRLEDMSFADLGIEDGKPSSKKGKKDDSEEEAADDEDEDEDEEEADDEEEDDADDEAEIDAKALKKMTRSQLKALIADKEIDVTVKKSMSDDDIRKAILDEVN